LFDECPTSDRPLLVVRLDGDDVLSDTILNPSAYGLCLLNSTTVASRT
jgi:hypothetical protein